MRQQLRNELQILFNEMSEAGGVLLGIQLSGWDLGPYREILEAMQVDIDRAFRALNLILETKNAIPEWVAKALEDIPEEDIYF